MLLQNFYGPDNDKLFVNFPLKPRLSSFFETINNQLVVAPLLAAHYRLAT